MVDEPVYKGQLPWKDNLDPVSATNPFHTKDVSANTKLEQVRVLLSSGATEAGLTALKGVLDTLEDKDFSTAAKQDLIKGVVDTLAGDMAAVKADIAAMKTAMTDGTQKVGLSGTNAEVSSEFHTGTDEAKSFSRAEGAETIEIHVETGRVRVRTDGQDCTTITGEPLGEGFGASWAAPSISVFFIDGASITVVSR